VLDPLAQAHDFTLTDQHGQPFRLSDQRGKVVLLYFGYTSCPDVCPTTLAALAAVRRALGPDAQKVQVVFITVDPGRDTQEVIQRYLASFDPSFIGLRGTQAKLDPIIEAYGVTASADSHDTHAHDYKVTHSSYVYVIDPAGRWRMVLHEDDKVEDIVSDVRYLAQNEAS
jgi:protein SCO1/2